LPANFDDIYLHYAREGSRVLALGHKELGVLSHQQLRDLSRASVESKLQFAGFLIISCPLKADSKAVVKEILHSSHHLTMITGDNPLTACHVASELKLIHKKHALVLGNDGSGTWTWKSVYGDQERRHVSYPLEQRGYVEYRLA
jgi:cation-transporting ATPase 13A1